MNTFIKAGVIGHPVEHSKSPLIHNYWIKKYGLSGSYEAINIAPDDLERKAHALFNQGYAGFNITIPHKEAVMSMCDALSPVAEKIGAVNTLYRKDESIIGTNTDMFGFVENIKQARPGFDFAEGAALVLGAGGAAKAVIYGLIEEGTPEVMLANRTREKAENLVNGINSDKIRVLDWTERNEMLGRAHLLVNTTSLGMKDCPALDLDLNRARPGLTVNDIVYVPLMTDLLKQAEAKELPFVTGIGMLLQQARPAFEKWFEVMPEVDKTLETKVLAG